MSISTAKTMSHTRRRRTIGAVMTAAATSVAISAGGTPSATAETSPTIEQLDITGPPGSERFGEVALVLSNGNFVVADPGYDLGAEADVGAIYLYDGMTNQQISMLTGSTAGDEIGGWDIIEVGDSNVVATSREWDNGPIVDAGVATWIDGTTGLSGVVDTTNSLHGSSAGERLGSVFTLTNGNYVVTSQDWDDGAVANVGAVVWASGNAGITGPVTVANSLHGTSPEDKVGFVLTPLTNGNFVVRSEAWDNGAIVNAGAATWVDGTTGLVGAVSTGNSLYGTMANDAVGTTYALANGHYVVVSSGWDLPLPATSGVGAVTWGDGVSGTTGPVTASNSLHGATAGDEIGNSGVAALTNGNYVIGSQYWDFGVVADAGAATWADGSGPSSGPVTAANSLHGTSPDDQVPVNGVVPLTNGNYVVNANAWDNGGTVNAGAAVWGDGTTGISGPITPANSLHGTSTDDQVGFTTPLANGNYVVRVPGWDDLPTANVGAAVWGDGSTGIVGPVTTTNSLHGTTASDDVGDRVTPLTNGNYVVASRYWSFGSIAEAGAVTWADGSVGLTGPVTTSNSLHGTTTGDSVRSPVALDDGNYVVRAPDWDNAGLADVGAAIWADGTTGRSGPVTAASSLVGSVAGDRVGSAGVVAIGEGDYVVLSDEWDGSVPDAGAATLGIAGGVTGEVTTSSSGIGTPPGAITDAAPMVTSGDAVVVTTEQNRVILLQLDRFEPSDLVPLDPGRLLDTRPAPVGSTVDGESLGADVLQGGEIIEVPIAGRHGVPDDASAASLNLAAIAPAMRGFATLYPCTDDLPVASSLNYETSTNISNATTVKLSADGSVCIYTSADAHFALDVLGYTPIGSNLETVEPARLLDTRPTPAGDTIDDQDVGSGTVDAGSFVEVDVAGRAGVPDDAVSAIVNLAAITPSGKGFASLYPCTGDTPTTASLNFDASANISNTTIVKLSSTGSICIYTSERAHFALDVMGFAPVGSNVGTADPARLLDTRVPPAGATVDDESVGAGPVPADGTVSVPIIGRGMVPDSATAALLNVAVIAPEGKGFATLYPCTEDVPTAASLNYETSANVSNATLVKLSDSGAACIYTSAGAHFALDVVGYVD